VDGCGAGYPGYAVNLHSPSMAETPTTLKKATSWRPSSVGRR
jgi:hypothetical protein